MPDGNVTVMYKLQIMKVTDLVGHKFTLEKFMAHLH